MKKEHIIILILVALLLFLMIYNYRSTKKVISLSNEVMSGHQKNMDLALKVIDKLKADLKAATAMIPKPQAPVETKPSENPGGSKMVV